ncbi:MAG: hypothetical protein GX066_07020 [Clostridiaceae bacterium]|nr:hypothetical protein [Clostridiaceae bacterium]
MSALRQLLGRSMHMVNKKRYIGRKTYWFTFFGLMILKYGYYGFAYFPILDDWIQYGGYRLYDDIFNDVVIRTKLYTVRPLANLSDPYIWGRFWGAMGIVFFIITFMHAASAYLICKVLEDNDIPVGMPFLIIFGLLPLGTEATYWISASTRIVVGIFMMALSLYFLNLSVKKNSISQLIAFFFTNLLSMGYYEQVTVLSFFCALLLMAANWNILRRKWSVILPFINLLAIGTYYKIFSHVGNSAVRGQMVKSDYIAHTLKVLDEITNVFGQAHIPLYLNGFPRGMRTVLSNGSYLFLVLFFAFSLMAALIAYDKQDDVSPKGAVVKILLGFVLFWVPFGPNFILELVWICNRNAFTSFIGLGIMADGLVDLFLRKKTGAIIRGAGVLVAAFVFLVVNVSELTDYKNVSKADHLLASNILNAVKDEGFLEGSKKAILFNIRSSYIEQNAYYRDHIHNISDSDWALTGGVRAVAKNVNIQYIQPVRDGGLIAVKAEDLMNSILLGVDKDLSVFSLKPELQEDGSIMLLTEENIKFGTVHPGENQKYMFKKD